jgi:hypothetical protein
MSYTQAYLLAGCVISIALRLVSIPIMLKARKKCLDSVDEKKVMGYAFSVAMVTITMVDVVIWPTRLHRLYAFMTTRDKMKEWVS